ncbi:MAG: aminotransferase class V-fold PLP-dependent enzyme [Bacteroidota bacterium]
MKRLLAGASVGALSLSPLRHLEARDKPGRFQPDGLDDEALWEEVRQQFTFAEGQIYFNCATFGLMPAPVQKAMAEAYQKLIRGRYNLSKKPRKKVAQMLNAEPKEVALTHNTTEGINIVAAGLPLRRRDEIIMTDNEHVGNALPWLNRARLDGVRIKVFSPAPTAAETLNRINDLVSRRTRVIAVPHITCTTGQVLPITEIATLAREKGAYSFFDGAHGPGTTPMDMAEIGGDFYASCGHKWLCGPPGTGMLYVRQDRINDLKALMIGAYSDTGWELSRNEVRLDPLVETAHRFDYGTQNNSLRVGMMAAIEFMEKIGWEKIHARGCELAAYLQEKLLEMPHVEMLTPVEAKSRSFVIGFKVKGRSLEYFRKNIPMMSRVRIRMVPESGLNSLRISTHIFNTKAEIDELLAFVEATKL